MKERGRYATNGKKVFFALIRFAATYKFTCSSIHLSYGDLFHKS